MNIFTWTMSKIQIHKHYHCTNNNITFKKYHTEILYLINNEYNVTNQCVKFLHSEHELRIRYRYLNS